MIKKNKVITFIGSPRKKGNTSIMASALNEDLEKSDITTENIFLYDQKINPCVDCRGCKKDKMVCIIRDDMVGIYKKIEESEVVVIGTPIYWFGPSAPAKLLLDRFRPYYVNKKLNGKKAALLLPAGIGGGDCDLTIEMFKRSFKHLGVEFLGAVTAKAYDMGDVNNDKQALQNIKQLATAIINI